MWTEDFTLDPTKDNYLGRKSLIFYDSDNNAVGCCQVRYEENESACPSGHPTQFFDNGGTNRCECHNSQEFVNSAGDCEQCKWGMDWDKWSRQCVCNGGNCHDGDGDGCPDQSANGISLTKVFPQAFQSFYTVDMPSC